MSERTIIDADMKGGAIRDTIFSELGRATADSRHPFRYVVLGTVDMHGNPQNRWVVFRDFDRISNTILIYTDVRSAKVEDLRAHPRCSMLFYHDRKKLQLRVAGDAEVIEDEAVLQEHWQSTGHKGATSYTSVLAPGTPIEKPEDAWEWNKEDRRYFSVIRVRMERLEFLQLDGEKHVRGEFSWDGDGRCGFRYVSP